MDNYLKEILAFVFFVSIVNDPKIVASMVTDSLTFSRLPNPNNILYFNRFCLMRYQNAQLMRNFSVIKFVDDFGERFPEVCLK